MSCGELKFPSIFHNSFRRMGEFVPSLKLMKGALDLVQILGSTCGYRRVSAGVCLWEAVKSQSKSGQCSCQKEINQKNFLVSFQDTDL